MGLVQVPRIRWLNASPQGARAPVEQIGPVSQVPAAWWSAAELVGLVNNDPVSVATDLSGNDRDLVQGTGSLQPVYKTAIQNGLPVIRFDGADDFLRALFTLTQPFQVFVAWALPTLSHGKVPLSGGSGTAALRVSAEGARLSLVTTYGFEDIVFMNIDAAFHVVTGVFDETGAGANSSIQLDGGAPDGGNAGDDVAAGGITVGANEAGANAHTVDLGEMFVYKPPLDGTDSDTVRAELRATWGTP